jgi:hypothetical protein
MGQLHCSSPGAAKPTRDQREVYDLLHSNHAKGLGPKRNERQSYERGQNPRHRSGMG